ncbi:PRC-barrel domain-containing protein AvaK [Stanieria sp. NIES-3757]|nr:PRC-barrel domain-containing protein AvaK [Stanieria sp. NIES-3757]
MALHKIEEFVPRDQQNKFEEINIKNYSVYAGTTNEKIGSVYDVLVDDSGHFRYFVVDTGFWIFGKKVLLPIGQALIDSEQESVYALGIANQEQAEALPEYNDDMVVDYDYEERVRRNYRSPQTSQTTYQPDNYSYDRDAELYNLNERNGDTIKLYQERLIANKNRVRTGEVSIGKRVETETANVAVPVEKERVVVERHTPTERVQVAPGEANFQSGEVARMDVYEESANIEKQAFVREEVSVRKEVEQETVNAQEQIRREELEIDSDGKPIIEKK